jgi:hypothetical protein
MAGRHLPWFCLALASCNGSGSPGAPPGGGGSLDGSPSTPIAADGGRQCQAQLAMPPVEGANHVPDCTPVTYRSNPPSSGNHYSQWAVFRVYTKPVPWGYLVHALEHGAVVISYNCPDGCPEEVAAATELVQSIAPKPACSRPPVILTPEPTLDVRFAASAWGYTLRDDCFERDAFARFIDEHHDRGPEMIPGDCGLVDLEARNWCGP